MFLEKMKKGILWARKRWNCLGILTLKKLKIKTQKLKVRNTKTDNFLIDCGSLDFKNGDRIQRGLIHFKLTENRFKSVQKQLNPNTIHV